MMLGVVYFCLDSLDCLIFYLECIVFRGKDSDWIYYYLGLVYKVFDDMEKSIEYLELVIELGIFE